jgi:hypothetical protein
MLDRTAMGLKWYIGHLNAGLTMWVSFPHWTQKLLMLLSLQPSQPKDTSDIQMQHRVEINVEKNIQYDEDQPMTVQFFNGSGKSSTAFASSETS